jgi:hypothetical protein
MRPVWLVAVALALPLAVAPPALGVDPGPLPAVLAAGPVHHVIDYDDGELNGQIYTLLWGDSRCDADGAVTLAVEDGGRALVVNADSQCLPGFSSLSTGCTHAPDTSVHCFRQVGSTTIVLDLAPDGAFDFTWTEPTFAEHIFGTLVRTP